MHEIWSLGSDDITREVHPTAQIDVVAETFGQFATQYFAENGRKTPVIGKISVNRSVKLWELLPMLGDVDFRSLVISWLPLFPMVGGTTIPPIRTGPLSWGYLT